MPKSNANLALKGLDEMFSTEESRQEQKREQVQQIPIEELFPFKEHPLKVLDDEAMVVSILRRSNISMITTCGSVLPCSISANLRRGWRAAMPLWNRNL